MPVDVIYGYPYLGAMINWQALISDLEALGFTRSMIAAHCGLGYSTLCDIANGRSAEPRGTAAVRLSDLHRSKLTGDQPGPSPLPNPPADQAEAA